MDSVRINGFALEVHDIDGPVEKIIYDEANYYAMADRTEYTLKLTNDLAVRTDAHVWINGEHVGVWRINPYSTITIERPANVSRRFTLFKEGTRAAMDAGIIPGSSDNGLIKIVFKPEAKVFYEAVPTLSSIPTDLTLNRSMCNMQTDSVTPHTKNRRFCEMNADAYNHSYSMPNSAETKFMTLTSQQSRHANTNFVSADHGSNQRFTRVTPLNDIDARMVTTIYARLIVDNDNSGYRRSYIGVRNASRSHLPPPRLHLSHPSRPHSHMTDSPFTLSRKFWFDSF